MLLLCEGALKKMAKAVQITGRAFLDGRCQPPLTGVPISPEPQMDNPFAFPTHVAIQQLLHHKTMEQSNSKERLQLEAPMLSASCQTQRGGVSSMENFQHFNMKYFNFSTVLRLLQTKEGPLCWEQATIAANQHCEEKHFSLMPGLG